MKKQLLHALLWVIDNGYEIALSVTCFLVAVEIVDTWLCWGVLFVSFIVWGLKKNEVWKPLRDKL